MRRMLARELDMVAVAQCSRKKDRASIADQTVSIRTEKAASSTIRSGNVF